MSDDDDGEIPNLDAKPGDVLTMDGWKNNTFQGGWQPSHPLDREILKKYYEKQNTFKYIKYIENQKPEIKGKTPFHAKVLAIAETRIQILEDKANDAKMWPGVEYGKILTAIKEVRILFDLIREVKI